VTPYPAYVETSEPSLSAIPAHWRLLRVKNVGRALIGLTYNPDDVVDEADEGTLVLRSGNVQDGRFDFRDNVYVKKSVPSDLRLRLGDIVVCARNGSARLIGKNAVATIEVTGQTWGAFMAVLRSDRNEYLRWVLNSQIFEAQTGLYSTATINQLTSGTLHNLRFAMPPLDEQRQIASYLDREAVRIDTLIEEQQRLIEMLRERRKAVVEQAVFSGLEGAPTKSNAEPWLPPTPSHWRVVQLGFVSDTVAGYAFSSDGFSADEDHVRLLRGVNVKPGRINWADTVYWDVDAAAVPSEFVLEVGDLVFGMDRPFVGGGVRVAAISGNDLPALLLQRVMRIRPNDEAGRGYMRYVMSTDVFFNYLEPLFTGVSVPHVSEWQVRKFKMPFPPLDEQKSIGAYLDEQTAKIDTLIAETERFIELARERRSALITAAVTGQIDVREMV
jgi:type I restriction enzyme S subunit